jgi:hypothetical protein
MPITINAEDEDYDEYDITTTRAAFRRTKSFVHIERLSNHSSLSRDPIIDDEEDALNPFVEYDTVDATANHYLNIKEEGGLRLLPLNSSSKKSTKESTN